jgi:glycine betaine/proline transport system ATP-binding protein
VLRSQHPVRVHDGDRFLGVIDEDDLLRVIVAEDVPREVQTS